MTVTVLKLATRTPCIIVSSTTRELYEQVQHALMIISKHPKKESVPILFQFLKHLDIMVLSAEQHEKSMFIPSCKLRSNKSSGKYVNSTCLDRWKLYFRL